ncbi:SDR family NAD(P)-dependent oxidoreductase [Larkinella punicea]|uniref:SDR family NAD(P)-dependent oxidoreductase n=1 Tax=Larkinella punicea TaxID=2315727 RepID=A0A368JJQ0_9BACT|nr:SDR family oxidoreductase [Larkinella punicea]RCR67889.1 SDR family NAD(P)-dependent oxidoreductase [Larkinella punicea]
MSNKLANKVVIVTGASKGIGAGIAKQMGAEGAKVVVNYVSSKEDADNVVNAITNQGGTAIAIQGDVSKSDDVKRLFGETKEAFGGLDVLVNNAGIYWALPLADFTEDAYRKMFDVNVLGTLLTSHEALTLFDEKGGSIINISSVAGRDPEVTLSVYGATKAAMSLLTTSLSKELGPKNIRVNSILSSMILTEGLASLGLVANTDNPYINLMTSRTALGRLGTAEEIGHVAVFLSTDEASFVTGQEIEVSGGFK